MGYKFYYAKEFNQFIGHFILSNEGHIDNFLTGCGIDCGNYSATLSSWKNNPKTANNLILIHKYLFYGSNVKTDRNYLINSKGWEIYGDRMNSLPCYPSFDDVTIYPNPASHSLTIKMNNLNFVIESLQIFNSIGQMVYSTSLREKLTKYTIDVSGFAKGVYILKFEDKTQKIVIE